MYLRTYLASNEFRGRICTLNCKDGKAEGRGLFQDTNLAFRWKEC